MAAAILTWLSFDISDSEEVRRIVEDLDAQKKESGMLKKAVGVVIFMFVVLCGVMLAVVLAGNEMSKESKVKGGAMVTTTGEPVKIEQALSDFSLADLNNIPFDQLKRIKDVTFEAVTPGTTYNSVVYMGVASFDRTPNDAGDDYVTKLWSSLGDTLTVAQNVTYRTAAPGGGLCPSECEVVVGQPSPSMSRRRLADNAEDAAEDAAVDLVDKPRKNGNRRLAGRRGGALMTMGSFTMMSSNHGVT